MHMPIRRLRHRATTVGLLVASALVLPDAADAHGIGGATDLPIPGWLFAWAASAVLLVSFVALGVLWPKPRLAALGRQPVLTLPRWLDPVSGALGVAMTAGLVYTALVGTTDSATNLTPTFVWVVFWVALPLASFVLGDLYTPFDPRRALARVARRGRTPRPYPERLGRWPAAAGLVGIGWLELVSVHRADPR